MIAEVLSGDRAWCVEGGVDCIDVMRTIPDASVDAICTDPPAGIGFMGRSWDSDKGGRDMWIAWLAERMREALRVLKPGGHALVWALPRTSHWTAMALEDAGFEIRDRVSHLFGSGFPKSLDVSKGVDKLAGAEREIVGESLRHGSNATSYPKVPGATSHEDYGRKTPQVAKPAITAPATPDAEQWDGWGTALKPACEDWWLVRKPLRGSIVRNVLEHGTGAINVGACRVPHASAADFEAHAAGVAAIKAKGGVIANVVPFNTSDLAGASDVTPAGRWPANLVLSHADGCERVGTRKVKAAPPWNDNRPPSLFTGAETSPVHHTDGDGTETIDDWRCADGCPVKELDVQSGQDFARPSALAKSGMGYRGGEQRTRVEPQYADEGGASRYFTTFAPFLYTPKADRADRENGCEHMPTRSGGELTDRKDGSAALDSPRSGAGRRGGRANHHPTVKSTDLMRWLVRLITPPRGVVLDPFTGSGSTGVACSAEGFRFIGVELDPAYAEIARARIIGDAPLFNAAGSR